MRLYKFMVALAVVLSLTASALGDALAEAIDYRLILGYQENANGAVWPTDGSRIDSNWEHVPIALKESDLLTPGRAASFLFGTSKGVVEGVPLPSQSYHGIYILRENKTFYIDDLQKFEAFGGGLAAEVDSIVVWYPFIDTNGEAWAWEYTLTKSNSGNRLVEPEFGGDPQLLELTLSTNSEYLDLSNPKAFKSLVTLSLGFPE